MKATGLAQKLWNYCNILPPSPRLRRTGRDDGLSYGDYVEVRAARTFIFLLFLKMADEQSRTPSPFAQSATAGKQAFRHAQHHLPSTIDC